MVHFKDRYKEESFCGNCGEWTPEPTHKPIYGNYGYIIAVREHHEYPHVYDDKGNTYDVQTLIPIKQLNRRGLDGTLFEEITEFRSRVKCKNCGKICRGGSYSKTGSKNHYIASYRPVGRPKGSILYKSEKNKIIDYFNDLGRNEWGHGLGRNKNQTIIEIAKIMEHLKQRGFTVSEVGHEKYVGDSGVIDIDNFNIQPGQTGLSSFDDVIIYLELLNDEKKRQHLVKWITNDLLILLKDEEFNQTLLQLGIRKIDKNDILTGITAAEGYRRHENSSKRKTSHAT